MHLRRTSKCDLIRDEMPWHDRLVEYQKLGDSSADIMSLSPQERALIASAMTSKWRYQIIESLPPNLATGEFKRQLYFRTYGEHLPEDFFKDEE